jgi:hypothetical protein
VIGLLMTIGLATFAGASEKAHGRAAEVELRTALEAALLLAQESRGRFVVDDQPISPEDLHAEEPALAFADIGQRRVIGVSVSADATTIRLDQLDDGGTRHTLVAEIGRGFRFCAGVEPAMCALEVDEIAEPSPEPTTVTTTAPGNSGDHRQDGTTPANDNRQNGR